MDLTTIKKVHFIGLGGIGVSAIAKMMFCLGKEVSGSDLSCSEITDELAKKGVKVFLGHKASYLDPETNLVIYSPAVSEENPEIIKAKKLKIPTLSYPEFLGLWSRNKFTIAVSGTNGKSTTTALIGLILEKAGLDPTVIVGSKVDSFKEGNLRFGQSQYLVVEACEWRAHMLNLFPQVIVLTNLETDHLDYYRGIEDIIIHFQKYIDQLPDEGKIILNIDDKNLSKKLQSHRKVISYGIKKNAEVMAKNVVIKSGRQAFDLIHDSKFLIHNSLRIPGLFNIYNSLAAATCALTLGVKVEVIKETLEEFKGIWRRFEVKKLVVGSRQLTVVSDYAHHPTAVRTTIKAAKEFYPKRRIFVVFQPHHHHRTKALFNDFVKSFDEADLVIISEIYGVAGREKRKDQNISSKDLVAAIKQLNNLTTKQISKLVLYAKDLTETKKLILENIKENDIVLIMGAGDIYKVADNLVNSDKRK